jgi:dTDP-4-dehydrorhamnose 3,5-epimerase-like enzyme
MVKFTANTRIMKAKIINIPKIEDPRGNLSVIEKEVVPFKIKRVYYLYDVPAGVERGGHAHKKLQQIIWCPYGQLEVIIDDGETKKSYLLNSPNKALVLIKGYWREIKWRKKNSILVVAASDYFKENDYIRDYYLYLAYIKKGIYK